MTAYFVPLLFAVAGVCFHSGVTHLWSAWRERSADQARFGLLGLFTFAYALFGVQFERGPEGEAWMIAARQTLVMGHLWNVAFVGFVAYASRSRGARALVVLQGLVCVTLIVLDGTLPGTLLFGAFRGEQPAAFAGPVAWSVATVNGTPAVLEFLPWLISFGFAAFCWHGPAGHGERISSLGLVAASAFLVAVIVIHLVPALRPWREFDVGIFVLFAFALLMSWQTTAQVALARDARQSCEARFRQMAESIQDVFYLSNIQTGAVVYTSPAYETLTGHSVAELAADPRVWLEAVLPADRDRVMAACDKLSRGDVFREEYRVARPDGSIRWVLDRAHPVRDPLTGEEYVAGVVRDITEEKQASRALEQAELRLRLILENISDAVFLSDDQGRFQFVCPNARQIFGYEREEIVAMGNVAALLGADLFDDAQLAEQQELRNIERQVLDNQGGTHDLLITVKRVSIQGGTRLYACRDVSFRKQAERAVVESKEKLEAQFAELEQIYRTSPVGLCLLDTDLRVVRINDEMAAIHERPASDFRDRLLRDVLPSLADLIEPNCRRVLTTGAAIRNAHFDRRCTGAEGDTRHYLASYYPVSFPGKTPFGINCVVQDITEVRRAERVARQNEELVSAILASLPAHIAVVDRQGRITKVNAAWTDFARANGGRDEVCGVGVNYLDVCRRAAAAGDDAAAAVVAGLEAVLRGEAGLFRHEYPCHSECVSRWFMLQATPLQIPRGGAVLSHFTITERIEAEQRLTASEQRLQAILNTAVDAIITIDRQGTIDGINPAAERMFGYASGELVGSKITALLPSPSGEEPEGDAAQRCATLVGQFTGDEQRCEVVGLRQDGSTFPAEISLSEVASQQLITAVLRDISERKRADAALRESVEFNERLIDTAHSVVLVLDNQNHVVSFNRFFERLTGRRLEDVRGTDFCQQFMPQRNRHTTFPSCTSRDSGDFGKGTILPVVAHDGTEREIEWYNACLRRPDGERIGMLCTGQDVTARQQLQREVLDIANREQRRIGQELHDNTQQQLIGLGLLAKSLKGGLEQLEHAIHDADATADQDAPRGPTLIEQRLAALHTKSAQIQDGLGQAAREVQQLARGLVSVEVDARGLLSALCELARTVDAADGVRCSFTCDCPDCCEDGFDVHDSNVTTQLYRIVQEAVSNAVKHGHASEIAIDLCIHDELTILRVTDNGVGLDESTASPGMGLRIMAHRAELIGAYLHFGPAARGGTEVTCAFHQPPAPGVSSGDGAAVLQGRE